MTLQHFVAAAVETGGLAIGLLRLWRGERGGSGSLEASQMDHEVIEVRDSCLFERFGLEILPSP